MKIEIRLAVPSDLAAIEKILTSGREYLHRQGLPQWQDGYGPTKAMAEQDIEKKEGYVLTSHGHVCGYATLSSGIDDAYTHIDGHWDETHPTYRAIHRVAIEKALRGQGLSKKFMELLMHTAKELGCHDVRIDTHPGNEIMIRLITQSGFTYRGMITFPFPNGERRAYQRII